MQHQRRRAGKDTSVENFKGSLLYVVYVEGRDQKANTTTYSLNYSFFLFFFKHLLCWGSTPVQQNYDPKSSGHCSTNLWFIISKTLSSASSGQQPCSHTTNRTSFPSKQRSEKVGLMQVVKKTIKVLKLYIKKYYNTFWWKRTASKKALSLDFIFVISSHHLSLVLSGGALIWNTSDDLGLYGGEKKKIYLVAAKSEF